MAIDNLKHSERKIDLWHRAAIAGGLWASFEIIVGSALHNMRLPFAGGVLASVGVVLMVAFYKLWPEKGLIWRAGMVCALMKSISPSAIIFGPMIGIMLEAMVLYLFIRLFGGHVIVLALAGGFAVLTALLQKLFNLLVLYGNQLVQVYVNMIAFASRQLHVSSPNSINLLFWLMGIYFMIGVLAAFAGFRVGRRAEKMRLMAQIDVHEDLQFHSGIDFLKVNPVTKYSKPLLALNFLVIPAGLLSINTLSIAYAAVFVGLFLFYASMRYPNLPKRFSKPALWVQMGLVVLLTAMFYDVQESGIGFFKPEGWQIGIQMVLRALLIFTAFSALAVELRNPAIIDHLRRGMLKKPHEAVTYAFGILPSMIDKMPKVGVLFREPIDTFAGILARADDYMKKSQ